MDNPSAYTGPAWRVTSQQEATQPGPAGTYTKGVVVFFNMDDGNAGSVFIPNNVYNAAAIKAAINERAAQLGAVQQLKSD